MNVERPKRIACDFDFTLARFVTGIETLLNIITCHGVSEYHARAAWQQAESEGFTVDRLHRWAEYYCRRPLPQEQIRVEFAAWLRVSLALYPDVPDSLRQWLAINIPMTIVTFGDRDYQRQKIAMLRLDQHDVVFVSQPEAKWFELEKLVRTYGSPIIFVDDNVHELDKIYEHGLQRYVTTIWLRRFDSPYAAAKAKFDHHEVDTLDKLRFV